MSGNLYYPKCHICDSEVMSYSYSRDVKYTCKKCKIEIYLTDKDKKSFADYETKERKFDNAVKRIKKSVVNHKKYEKAFEIIHDKLHTYGWFDSTEEIMVAIELVKNKINARHQVKMGRYKADFILPDKKVVLEIDGRMFHTERTKEKEILRDNLIVLSLGPEWDVVRITDDLINKKISKLVTAINKVKSERALQRKNNSGIVSEWYSDRFC